MVSAWRWYFLGCLGIGWSLFGQGTTCIGQIVPPIYMVLDQPMADEFGHRLEGNNPAVVHFGIEHVPGDLVLLLQGDQGIHPPKHDGRSHRDNPVLFTSRIGMGISPLEPRPGRLADTVLDRPEGFVFVRVFNGSSLRTSTFYRDSSLFRVRDSDILHIILEATDQPIDTRTEMVMG